MRQTALGACQTVERTGDTKKGQTGKRVPTWPFATYRLVKLVPPAGFEPATPALGEWCLDLTSALVAQGESVQRVIV